MPFDAEGYEEADNKRGVSNAQSSYRNNDQRHETTNAVAQPAYPLNSDPNYRSVPFGERRRLLKQQKESSTQADVYQNEQRSKKTIRGRKIINRAKDWQKRIAGQDAGVKKFKALRDLAALWEVFFAIYIVQVIGWAFAVAGFGVELFFEELSLRQVFDTLLPNLPGDIFGELVEDGTLSAARVIPGQTVFLIGHLIAAGAGIVTFLIVAAMLVKRQIGPFSTGERFYSGAVSFALYCTPIVNILPFAAFWLMEVMTSENEEVDQE